ncbi:MAG: amidohydrolase family protein [Leucobacter sp.]
MSSTEQGSTKVNGTAMRAVSGVRVLNEQGGFSSPQRVSWVDGTFVPGGEPQLADLDGSHLWLTPGLVDAHTHVSWHAFSEKDRENDTGAERDAKTAGVLETMLRAGFTSVRDAGGFARGHAVAQTSARTPRVQTSVAMITRAAADAEGGVLALTERALEAGARWIKLVGTASVASPAGSGLEPMFTLEEQRTVVERAREVGAGVMLHAWGGDAIDDAIEAGVMSIEHGIFLTPEQADRAAGRRMTLVPTLRIYTLVERMIERGSLPAAFGPRVREAVRAHPDAVRHARDAGLAIALGSDFGDSDQHGTNRTEFDDLVRAGLSSEEALVSATRSGAELLARVAVDPFPRGRITDGEIADAVLFTRDPREPGAFSGNTIAAVVLGGNVADGTGTGSSPTSNDSHPRKDIP